MSSAGVTGPLRPMFREDFEALSKCDKCKLYGKNTFKAVAGIVLLATAAFGVLGLLHTHGIDLSKTQWLTTALDKVGNNVAFGAMAGGGAGLFLIMLGKACRDRKIMTEAYRHWWASSSGRGDTSGFKAVPYQEYWKSVQAKKS